MCKNSKIRNFCSIFPNFFTFQPEASDMSKCPHILDLVSLRSGFLIRQIIFLNFPLRLKSWQKIRIQKQFFEIFSLKMQLPPKTYIFPAILSEFPIQWYQDRPKFQSKQRRRTFLKMKLKISLYKFERGWGVLKPFSGVFIKQKGLRASVGSYPG